MNPYREAAEKEEVSVGDQIAKIAIRLPWELCEQHGLSLKVGEKEIYFRHVDEGNSHERFILGCKNTWQVYYPRGKWFDRLAQKHRSCFRDRLLEAFQAAEANS